MTRRNLLYIHVQCKKGHGRGASDIHHLYLYYRGCIQNAVNITKKDRLGLTSFSQLLN